MMQKDKNGAGDEEVTKVLNNLFNGLENHFPVRFALILQVINNPRNHFGTPNLIRNLHCRLHLHKPCKQVNEIRLNKMRRSTYHLFVVAPVKSHSSYPKMAEEVREDGIPHIRGFDALGGHTLLDHLENYLLHLLIGGLELTDEDRDGCFGIVLGVLSIHERDYEPNSLKFQIRRSI